METAVEEKTRIVNFDGSMDNWRMWSQKFLAIETKKGWNEILTGSVIVLEFDNTLAEGSKRYKKMIKLKLMNASLYAELILCQDDNVAFDLVVEAVTNKLPKKDAALAWTNLKNKYESTSMTELMSLKQEFYSSKLINISKNPDMWISKMEKLRKRLNVDFKAKITDLDMITQILNNLPIEYDSITELIMMSLEAVTPPTLLEVRNLINTKFKNWNLERRMTMRF